MELIHSDAEVLNRLLGFRFREKIVPVFNGVALLANGKLVHKQQVRHKRLLIDRHDNLVKLVAAYFNRTLITGVDNKLKLRGMAAFALKHHRSSRLLEDL
jgi:hypothetical protein